MNALPKLQARARDLRESKPDAARVLDALTQRSAACDVPDAWLLEVADRPAARVTDETLSALASACPQLRPTALALQAMLDRGVPRPIVLYAAGENALQWFSYNWLDAAVRHEIGEWLNAQAYSKAFVAARAADIRRAIDHV